MIGRNHPDRPGQESIGGRPERPPETQGSECFGHSGRGTRCNA
jgi:hypothetical protein